MGEGVWPSRYFYWSGEVAACTEKYPEEGSRSFDRQVTDRRRYLPGKYRAASRKNSTGSYLQKSETHLSLLAEESGADLSVEDM